jgi:hypothetical protein
MGSTQLSAFSAQPAAEGHCCVEFVTYGCAKCGEGQGGNKANNTIVALVAIFEIYMWAQQQESINIRASSVTINRGG